jgi:hypothetical protein
LNNNSCLRNMMNDYLHALLTSKPDDIIVFTSKHFSGYSYTAANNSIIPQLEIKVNIPKK